MLRGLYAAASGLEANQIQQEVVTENLAHNNVPGYRRRGVVFETFERFLAQAAAPSTGATLVAQGPQGNLPQPPTQVGTGRELWGTRPSFVYTDFFQGPATFTGNPFDVAAVDNTFFVVEGPNGPLLTRNGAFGLNFRGDLITRSGLLLRGQNGRVVVPPQTVQLVIGREGTVVADGVEIGQILLANVPNPSALRRVGNSLFEGPIPNNQPIPGTVRVEQGYLELANAQVVNDLVTMLSGLRHYEAGQRALRALSDVIAERVRPQ